MRKAAANSHLQLALFKIHLVYSKQKLDVPFLSELGQ